MILHISPLGYTGLAYYDYSLCQSLSEEGLSIELCTSDRWILDGYRIMFKINYIYIKCSGNINKIVRGINYIKASARIFIHALRIDAKIIHFQIVELPIVDFVLMIALKLFGRFIVFTPHEIIHNKNYYFNNAITSLIYTTADRIIAHKEANMKSLQTIYGVDPNKIRIIPHGGYEYFVDGSISKEDARNTLGLSPDDRVLLSIGNIRPNKGIDILLKALPHARREIKRLKLVIAGKLSSELDDEWLNKIIIAQGISDVVILRIGFIPEKDVINYYMAADIVVLPYTSMSESGVLRYAQTCGKAVICSNLNEFTDTVTHGKTGYLFKSGDHIDLARQIKYALSDAMLNKIGSNAKIYLEKHYSWKKIALLTRNLYDELLKSVN
jgi:glycosyltransferase involved in cell wall biosynthesis